MGRFVRSTRPYWLKSKFGGKCSKCGFGIKKGEDIFYYPATKTVFCAGDGCGKKEAAALASDDFDQAMMNGSW